MHAYVLLLIYIYLYIYTGGGTKPKRLFGKELRMILFWTKLTHKMCHAGPMMMKVKIVVRSPVWTQAFHTAPTMRRNWTNCDTGLLPRGALKEREDLFCLDSLDRPIAQSVHH